MKEFSLCIGLSLFIVVLSWGKVGDIQKIIKTPGPRPRKNSGSQARPRRWAIILGTARGTTSGSMWGIRLSMTLGIRSGICSAI